MIKTANATDQKTVILSEKERQQHDKAVLKQINKGLVKSGFRKLTLKLTIRNINQLGLSAPNKERLLRALNQVVYYFELDSYKIIVYTTFDKRFGRFSDYGRPRVMIVDSAKQKDNRIYIQSFYKVDNLATNLINESTLLVDRLENRPAYPKVGGELMKLIQDKDMNVYWVPVQKTKKDIKVDFYADPIPEKLQSHVKYMKTRPYYQGRREELGVKEYIGNIIIPWNIGDFAEVVIKYS